MTDILVDARGRPCPEPVIELARAASRAEPGNIISVLSDDPAAPGDVRAWCEMRGHEFLGSDTPGETWFDLRVRLSQPTRQ